MPTSDVQSVYGGGGGGVADGNDQAKVSSNDTTTGYLNGKLVAGTNVTLTENNNGGNETLTIAAAGGVTGFTASQNTASPNNTVNASRLLVDAASTNADIVLQPKGSGAILAQLPDGTNTGGNKRNSNAVDLQTARDSANEVASGAWSVVAGGRANKATGSYSVCVGGWSNSANQNYAFIGAGYANITNNIYAAVAGGYGNLASGQAAAIAGGQNNAASAQHAVISGGRDNIASGTYSTVSGGYANTTSGTYSASVGYGNTSSGESSNTSGNGNTASSAISNAHGYQSVANNYGMYSYASGRFTANGDAQLQEQVLRCITTNNTATLLVGDGLNAGTSIVVANDTTIGFDILVVARRTDADNESASWRITGCVDNNAGNTALVGTPTITAQGDDSFGTWTIAVQANNTDDRLEIVGTGENSKTIRWVAHARCVKVTG